MKIKIFFHTIVLMIVASQFALYANVPGACGSGGGGAFAKTSATCIPSGSQYSAQVTVVDQNGYGIAGVIVTMVVTVTYGANSYLQPTYGTESASTWGTTDANGVTYLALSFGSWVGHYRRLDQKIFSASKSGFSVSSSWGNNNLQGYSNAGFTMILDRDQNGIADAWEYALSSKFNPTMILSHALGWEAPEPVEIIGAQSSANLYGTLCSILDGGPLATFPISRIRKYGGGNWHLMVESDGTFEKLQSDYYKDLFAVDYDNTGNFVVRNGIEFLYIHFSYAPTYAFYDPITGYFSDNMTSLENGWFIKYQQERSTNTYPHTYYSHMFSYGNEFIIQYWFFYPYNDYYNNHESDWEHISVSVNSQNPSSAQINYIKFYAHNGSATLIPGQFQTDNQTHPRVFVGGENAVYTTLVGSTGVYHNTVSGGSYALPGDYTNPDLPVVGGVTEHVRGNGPTISWAQFLDANPNDKYGLVILRNPSFYSDDDQSMNWFKSNVLMGFPFSPSPYIPFVIANKSLSSPDNKNSWSTP